MKFPKITIITPSYNQGLFIEETILSVINQNYSNLEYIVIDGGSTDDTIDIIKKYENKITYWISEKDEGQTHAINKGIKIASGEIINWINSDDLMASGALKAISDNYHPSIHFYLGKSNIINATGRITGMINQTNFSGKNYYDCLESGLNQPATFFRKEIIDRIGDLNTEYQYSFDLDFWKRFLLNYNYPVVKVLNHYLASFRVHENSKTFIQAIDIDSNFVKENNLAMGSYFANLSKNKRNLLGKILTIDLSPSNLKSPPLNYVIVRRLYNDIAYNNYISGKKTIWLLFKLIIHLDIDFILKKLFNKYSKY